MKLEIPTNNAKEKIEEFIEEFEELSDLSFKEGKDKKSKLDKNVKSFLKMAFSNGDKMVKDYTLMFIGTTGRKTNSRKQKDYEENITHKKDQLIAWKDNLEMMEELEESGFENENEKDSESPDSNITIESLNGDFIQGNKTEINIQNSFNKLKSEAERRNDEFIKEKIVQLEEELDKEKVNKSKVQELVSAIKGNADWAMPTLTTIILKLFGA